MDFWDLLLSYIPNTRRCFNLKYPLRFASPNNFKIIFTSTISNYFMKKILLFAFCNFLLVISHAQNVGIGTTTPRKAAKLHIIGDNTDTSMAALIDGNVLGRGLQVPRGGVGIGPAIPISRLFVATGASSIGIDTLAAIIGYALSDTSAKYGGVYGTYDPSRFGVGVQGIGYNGIDYRSVWDGQIDVGVHGSSDIGVSGIGNIYGVYGIGSYYGVYAEAVNLADTVPDEQYGLFASSSNATAPTKYAGYFDGDVAITGNLSKGSGTFKIDDPIDPANKYLYHSFVESPDMMNIYNGNITTDAKGLAEVTLPPYFDALNKDFRYQLTTIGTFAQAIIKEEVTGNHFTIQTSQPNVKVSWQVTGVRKDKFAEAHRVKAEVEKEPWNKGLYLHAREFGLDNSKSISRMAGLRLAPTPQNAITPSLYKASKRKTGRTTQLSKIKLIPVSIENK